MQGTLFSRLGYCLLRKCEVRSARCSCERFFYFYFLLTMASGCMAKRISHEILSNRLQPNIRNITVLTVTSGRDSLHNRWFNNVLFSLMVSKAFVHLTRNGYCIIPTSMVNNFNLTSITEQLTRSSKRTCHFTRPQDVCYK